MRTAFLLVILTVAPSIARAELLVVTNNRVLRYSPTTGEFRGIAVETFADQFFGITVGLDGLIYVSVAVLDNPVPDGIRRYDPKTFALIDAMNQEGLWTITGGGGNHVPWNPMFGPDGDFYVVESCCSIRRHDGLTGVFEGSATSGASLDTISQFAFGPDGNLYVGTRFGESGIVRFDGTTGQFIDVFLPGSVPTQSGFAFLPSGDLFIGGQVYPGPGGSIFGSFSTSGRYEMGADGFLYEVTSSTVVRRDPTTGQSLGSFASGFGGIGRGITFTSVPEPSTQLLLVIGALGSMLFRRPTI